MKIVLLESLGISQEILSGFAQQLEKQGHQFVSYEKNADEQVQIERAQIVFDNISSFLAGEQKNIIL